MQSLTAMINSIQPHRIALKSTMVLERPQALISSENIYGMSRADPSHIVPEILIRVGSGEMQCLKALINGSAMSSCITPRL